MKTPAIIGLLLGAACAGAQSLTLTEALAQARRDRPAVHAARLNIDRARLAARASGAYSGPTVGVGQSSHADLGATDQDLFFSQPLDVFGRTSSARAVGRAQVLVAEAEGRQALLEVQADVLRTYFEAVAATRLRDVARDLQGVAESLHRATVRRFEEGKVPEIQVTRASLELERATQSALLRQAQLEAALKRLGAAFGNEAAGIDPATSLADPTGDIDNRPDILALAARQKVAQAEANFAARGSLPELELIGLRSPWRDDSTSFGARLQLTWSINPGRHRDEQASARKAGQALQQATLDARQRAEAELASVDIEIAAARRQVRSFESVRATAADLVAKSQVGYTNGFGTLLDVLEATRAQREIEQELAEAQLALNLALAHKHTVVGTLLEVKS